MIFTKIRLIGLKQVSKRGDQHKVNLCPATFSLARVRLAGEWDSHTTPAHSLATTPLNAEASLVFHTGNDEP